MGGKKKKVEFKSAIAGNDGGVPCIADSFARELSGLSTGLQLIAVSRSLLAGTDRRSRFQLDALAHLRFPAVCENRRLIPKPRFCASVLLAR